MVMPRRLLDSNKKAITQQVVIATNAGSCGIEAAAAMLVVYGVMKQRHDDIKRVEIERDRITLVTHLHEAIDRDQDRWLQEMRDDYQQAIYREALPRIEQVLVQSTHSRTTHYADGRTAVTDRGPDCGLNVLGATASRIEAQAAQFRDDIAAAAEASERIHKMIRSQTFTRHHMPKRPIVTGSVSSFVECIFLHMPNVDQIKVDEDLSGRCASMLLAVSSNENGRANDHEIAEALRLVGRIKPAGILVGIS